MQGENATSVQPSKRAKPLSAGFRVLVVDNDSTCLAIISKMLHSFEYKVATVRQATDALSIIREMEDELDLVLAELNMPEMEEYELLERIGKVSQLPVVIMSANNAESAMLGCLLKGAMLYLVKPVTMHDVKNLWQHTYRKKRQRMIDIEEVSSVQWASSQGSAWHTDEEVSSLLAEEDQSNHEFGKREQKDMQKDEENDSYSSTVRKKPKMIWTDELRRKFSHAVGELGPTDTYPKNILAHMNVPELKKEHISSHLQKYRLSLKQDEDTEDTATSDYTGPSSGSYYFFHSQGGYLQSVNSQGGCLQSVNSQGGYLQAINSQGGYLQSVNSQGGSLQFLNSQGGYLAFLNSQGGYLQFLNSQGGHPQFLNSRGHPQFLNSQGGYLQFLNSQGGYLRFTKPDSMRMTPLSACSDHFQNNPRTHLLNNEASSDNYMSRYQYEQLMPLGEQQNPIPTPTYLSTAYAGSRISCNSDIVGLMQMDKSSKEDCRSELPVPSCMENSGFESAKRCSNILSVSMQEQQEAQRQQLLLPSLSLQPSSSLPQEVEKHNIYGDTNRKIDELIGMNTSPTSQWFRDEDFDDLSLWLGDKQCI